MTLSLRSKQRLSCLQTARFYFIDSGTCLFAPNFRMLEKIEGRYSKKPKFRQNDFYHSVNSRQLHEKLSPIVLTRVRESRRQMIVFPAAVYFGNLSKENSQKSAFSHFYLFIFSNIWKWPFKKSRTKGSEWKREEINLYNSICSWPLVRIITSHFFYQ